MSDPCANPTLQSPLNLSSKDKFIMILELPYILRKKAALDPSLSIEPVQISIYGTVVPDIAVPEVDVRYAGQNLHLSTYARPNYPPLSINYVVDNGYKNYMVLWKWLNAMNLAIDDYYGGTPAGMLSPGHSVIVGDQFEYQTTITVLALNEYNQSTIEFKYSKAFISRLGGINYSYRDGTVLEGSADFHYSQLDVQLPFSTSTNIIPTPR
jgi:hypothetical protein